MGPKNAVRSTQHWDAGLIHREAKCWESDDGLRCSLHGPTYTQECVAALRNLVSARAFPGKETWLRVADRGTDQLFVLEGMQADGLAIRDSNTEDG